MRSFAIIIFAAVLTLSALAHQADGSTDRALPQLSARLSR
jgi:hypothetical protein